MNKRLTAARLLLRSGLARRLAARAPARLLVVNYHRLRPAAGATSRFDDGVFETDAGVFRSQMQWLQAATTVLDEDGLVELAAHGAGQPGTLYSAVTFDDGYVDCVTLAQPVLDELGIRGIFFLPVEIIESRRLGWWDLAANLLKKTGRTRLQVGGHDYDLAADFAGSLQAILNRFKLEPAARTATLLEELASACAAPLASAAEQGAELLSWDQARALRQAGHAIGAHSLTHRVLATLDPATQAREIGGSRLRLEALLGGPVRSFAYPVGGPRHIDADSLRLVREAGYALAFTFNTGLAPLPLADRWQVPRESARTLEVLQAKAWLPGVMGLRRELALPLRPASRSHAASG